MTQTGILQKHTDRGYEDYVSMKKNLKSRYAGSKVTESIFRRTQTSPTSVTGVEFSEKGGLTMHDKTSTALTIVMASDTNDNAYDGFGITGHYITNAGVKSTFTAVYDTTDTTTEVACCADFYCWNLEDYTAATVLVSSIAVQAGDNVYVGTTGLTAELRIATIVATATYPVITTLFGAGDVYGVEESDTAGDVGLVCTLEYWTPWGVMKTASHTLAATTTNIVRLTDTTTGYVVLDYYRPYSYKTTAVTGKYVLLGYDADKRVGVVAIDQNFAVIEEAFVESLHSRLFVPAATEGKLFLGDITAYNSIAAKIATIAFTYTPKDGPEQSHTWIFYGTTDFKQAFAMELEPLTEVTITLADDAATPVACGIVFRAIEVTL